MEQLEWVHREPIDLVFDFVNSTATRRGWHSFNPGALAYIVVLVEACEQSVSDLDDCLLHESVILGPNRSDEIETQPLSSNGGFGLTKLFSLTPPTR